MEFDENMSLGKDKKGEFVKIKDQKYRVWVSSGAMGRVAKQSCLIFNKKQSSSLVNHAISWNLRVRFIALMLDLLINRIRIQNLQAIRSFITSAYYGLPENLVRLTNCQGIDGFSGTPLILKQESSSKLYTSCIYTSHYWRYFAKLKSFSVKESSNVCQAIDQKVLELLNS